MMNFDTVYGLSQFIPDESRYLQDSIIPGGEADMQVTRFSSCYQDLAFGWHFVRSMVSLECKLPPAVQNPSIIRAFNYKRYGTPDRSIIEAIAIHTELRPGIKSVLQALLYAPDASYSSMAADTGFSVETIKIYADLFHDAPGRADDHLFIANLIYPEGRTEEYDKGYQDRVAYSQLLKRAAYNMGTEEVLKLGGFRKGADETLSASEASSRLEDQIMTNAVFLSRTGFLNSRSCEGIRQARNLIAAAKHGGQDDSANETGIGLGPLSNSIMGELMKYSQPVIEERLRRQQEHHEANQALKNQIIEVSS